MFTARPNVLRSAIAIALSSFVLPPIKAGQDVRVKVTGQDHTKGTTHTREMLLTFGDGPTDAARISFTDEVEAEYTNTFFSSQAQKHNFEVFVATRQNLDKTATGYTTILKYEGKEVLALTHELAEGSVKLMVNPGLNDHMNDVKGFLLPGTPEDQQDAAPPKPPLLNALTSAADPEAFGRLLEAVKKTLTEKGAELQEGAQLTKVSAFKVPRITTDKTPFLRQEVHSVLPAPDPKAMLQDSASVFPDPEQSMSVIATGMIHSITTEDDIPAIVEPPQSQLPEVGVAKVTRKPLQQTVDDLLEARPLISFVTTDMTSPQVTAALPKTYPVLQFGGEQGEIVLNLDQVNPAALAWVKGASKGIHAGYNSLSVVHVDAPELRENCYHEQVKILRRVAASKADITSDDIALLSHYQQLISLLNFVIDNGKDFTFSGAMLQTAHLFARGIELRALLAAKFGGLEDVKVVVHSETFSQQLQAKGVNCCGQDADLTGDDDFRKLMLHRSTETWRALKHLHDTHPELTSLQEKVATLTKSIGTLQEQLDDTELPAMLDPSLIQKHFAELPEDIEETYGKLAAVSQHHSEDVSSAKLKEEWETSRRLVQHMADQEGLTAKMEALAKEHFSVASFLDENGDIAVGHDALFKQRINTLGFDSENDAAIIQEMVHTVPQERMMQVYQDSLVLEGVDLHDIHEHTISIARTGTKYPVALRMKRASPEKFGNAQEIVRTRRWLSEMVVPSDLPGEGAQKLLVRDERVLTEDTHQQLKAARTVLSDGTNPPVKFLARKLESMALLLEELEEDGVHPQLIDQLIAQNAKLHQKVWSSEEEDWRKEGDLEDFDEALEQIEGAAQHRNAILKVIKMIEPEEMETLRNRHATFQKLHKDKLLTASAIELGEFELKTLNKIKRAQQLTPRELQDTRVRLDGIQQELKELTRKAATLVTEVAGWGVIPTEEQLRGLPKSPELAEGDSLAALRTFIDQTTQMKVRPANVLAMIQSARELAELADSQALVFQNFLRIKEHWATLEHMLDLHTASVSDGQLEAFKGAMQAAGFTNPTDEHAQIIARFMTSAVHEDMVETIGNGFIELKQHLDPKLLTEPDILQAQLPFTPEQIIKARQLMLSQPDNYETLVELAKSLHKRSIELETITNLVESIKLEGLEDLENLKKLNTVSDKINRLMEVYEEKVEELNELKSSEQQSTEKISKLQAEVDVMQPAMEAIQRAVTEAEAHSDAVKQKATLGEKVETLATEYKDLKASQLALTEVNNLLTKDKENAETRARETQVRKLTKEAETKKQELKKLQREHTATRETEEVLKRHLPAVEGEEQEDNLINRAITLKEKRDKQQQEIKRLKEQLEQLEQQTPSRKGSSSSFNSDEDEGGGPTNQQLNDQLTAANRKLEEFEQAAQAVQQEIGTLAEKHKLQLEGDTLEAQVQFLQEKQANQADRLKQMEDEFRGLELTNTKFKDLLKPKTPGAPQVDTEASIDVVEKVTKLLEEVTSSSEKVQLLESEVTAKDEANALLANELTSAQEAATNAKTAQATAEESFAATKALYDKTEEAVTRFEQKYPGIKEAGGASPDVKKTLVERVSALDEFAEKQRTQQKAHIEYYSQENAQLVSKNKAWVLLEKDIREVILGPQTTLSQDELGETDTTSPSTPLSDKTTLELVQDLATALKNKGSYSEAAHKGAKQSFDDLQPTVNRLQNQEQAILNLVIKQEKALGISAQQDDASVTLTDRVRRVLIPSDTASQATSSRVLALEEDLRLIHNTLPKSISGGAKPNEETVPGGELKQKVQELVESYDEKKLSYEAALERAEKTEQALSERTKELTTSMEEASELKGQLQQEKTARTTTEQTLQETEETVKAYETKHQDEYKPDEGDSLPVRLKKASKHSKSKVRSMRAERDQLQQDLIQQKQTLDEVVQILDRTVPDDSTDSSVPKKSPLDRVQQLAQTKLEQEQEVSRLTQKVSSLEQAAILAGEEGKLVVDHAIIKQQLAEKETELSETQSKLGVVKTELDKWEKSLSITPSDEDDIPGRIVVLTEAADAQTTETATLHEQLRRLESAQTQMQIIMRSPVRLHPADLVNDIPDSGSYDILAQVVQKHSLRTDELLRQLQEMEQMLELFESKARSTYQVVLGKIKANMGIVDSFWDDTRRLVIDEGKLNQFFNTVNMPNNQMLKYKFIDTLRGAGSGGWVKLMEDVELLKTHSMHPAGLRLSHLTMAKSGLAYGDMQAVYEASIELEDYKAFYTAIEPDHWLTAVDHTIPHPDVLNHLPDLDVVITITLDEFRNLETFLTRHGARPEQFSSLIGKLQAAHNWVSVSSSGHKIDQAMFTRLQSAGSPDSTSFADLAVELNVPGKGAALQAVAAAAGDLTELYMLLEDARFVGGLLSAGKITPETLNMAYFDIAPAVARMALMASRAAPERYKQRHLQLQEKAIKTQAVKLLKHSLAVGILTDDDSVEVLEAMRDSKSRLYQAVKAVSGYIFATNSDQIRVIHHEISMVAELVSGNIATDSTLLTSLMKVLDDARKLVDARGAITNPTEFNQLLMDNGLGEHSAHIARLCTSSITSSNLSTYFNRAAEIKAHNGNKMIPLAVLQAAYQPDWKAEQFHMVKVLADSPEVKILAASEHATTSLQGLSSELDAMETASTEFQRLIAEVQALEQEKLKLHNWLIPDFDELKGRYADITLEGTHPDGTDSQDSVVVIVGKIKTAKTFGELESATKMLTEHPRVAAAKVLNPLLQKLEMLQGELPGFNELKAMEEFDTDNIKGASIEWIENADQNGRTKILEALKPLSVGDDNPEMEIVANQYEVIFGPLEPTATEESDSGSTSGDTPAAKSPIVMVVDAQEKLEELHGIQQKQALEPGDIARAKELATTLCEDDYQSHLEHWVGSNDEETLFELRDELTQLKDATDDAAKGRLDDLFNPAEVQESLELHARLKPVVEELRQAEPHVRVYRRANRDFKPTDSDQTTTYADAFQETVEDIAEAVSEHKQHLAKELTDKTPAPLADQENYPYPSVSESHREATEILGAGREKASLRELEIASKQVLAHEARRLEVTGDDDLDPEFIQQQRQVITQLESFCEDCENKNIVPKGTLGDLHEEGIINPTSVQEAKDHFSREVSLRKTARNTLERIGTHGASQLNEEMLEHVKILSVLSDTAEAAIPAEFRSVIVLIREMHADDPSIVESLEQMRKAGALKLGDLPEPIVTKFAASPEWQLLKNFIEAKAAVGDLGENVLIVEMVQTDPTTELTLSRKVAANMAAGEELQVQLKTTLGVLAELDSSDEIQAALFMKQAMSETDFALTETPASINFVVERLKQAYGTSLPDAQAQIMGGVIYRGLTIHPESWTKVETALGKMPNASPKMFSGAIKQIMNVDLQLGESLLAVNEAFALWLARSPVLRKMITSVHNYQLKADDLQAIRDYQLVVIDQRTDPAGFSAANREIPKYPKAAYRLQLSEEDMDRIARLPEEQWQKSVMSIAKDPTKFSATYAVTQTVKNVGDVGLRFALEFILDDINLYGGTGSIAILLGYADSMLKTLGLSQDTFLRAMLHAYTNDLFNPRFQQYLARWVTPFTSGLQAVRVVKDVYTYVAPSDVSAMSGALRSLSFFLLAELNDLTWGGALTKRMALAFRGFDQLVNIQVMLEDRIKRTRNRHAHGKITKDEMRDLIQQDLASIELLSKGGDNWREDCRKVVETLRGDDGISDAEVESYLAYIDSPLSYQQMTKTWEEGVATVSAVLSQGRPLMTPFTSSLPKYMILAGVVEPMIQYGINAVAPGVGSAIGKVPAALLGTAIPMGPVTLPPAVLGTAAVIAGTTAYDGMYNDFEATRQTWYPLANFIDTKVTGIDFEKSKQLGMEHPASWSHTLNSTLPWLSMSAPDNMWRSGTAQLIGDEYASIVFGHKQSYLGYGLRPFTFAYEQALDYLYNHKKPQITALKPEDMELPDVPGSTPELLESTSIVATPTSSSSMGVTSSQEILSTSSPSSSVSVESTPLPSASTSIQSSVSEPVPDTTLADISPTPSLSQTEESSETVLLEPSGIPQVSVNVDQHDDLTNQEPEEEDPDDILDDF